MKKKIIIIGSGGHSNIAIQEIDKINKFNIIGFIDEKKNFQNGKKILGNIKFLEDKFNNKRVNLFCAIGDQKVRKRIVKRLNKSKIKITWIKIISKESIVYKNVKIDEGSLIISGAVVNINSVIGKHCIINTNSSIDHDCIIKDFVNISPGVSVGGRTKIDSDCFLGIGASIKEKIHIRSNVVIGANSFVNKNCFKNSKYLGIPAKKK